MIKNRSLLSFLRRNLAACLCAAALYALVYNVVFIFRQSKGIFSDYNAHVLWAMQMSGKDVWASFYNGSDSLWHVCVWLFSHLFQPNIWKSAAAVTAAADTAAYFLLFKLWDRTLPEKAPRWLLASVTLAVFLVNDQLIPGGPFYIKDWVVKGALNTWHNPTSIMVRPFAVAVFYMTVNIYGRRRYGRSGLLAAPEDGCDGFSFEGGFRRQFSAPVYTPAELVLYPVCLLLSVYAKPSFLLVFAPAIFVFLLADLIRTKGMLFPFCGKLALAYLPAVCVMLLQYFHFFDGIAIGAESAAAHAGSLAVSIGTLSARAGAAAPVLADYGVRVYFMEESLSGLGSYLLMAGKACRWILMFCAFPLLIMLLASPKKHPGTAANRLGLICAVMGWLEALLLHETGIRATDGNFVWGYSLATWLFWTTVVGQYVTLVQQNSTGGKIARYGGTALLLAHLVSGIAYIVLIMQTRAYLM